MAFDKVKQLGELNKMRQQAKKLQQELEEIKHIEEKRGIKVKVTGDQKIDYVEIDGESRDDIKDVINKAFKNVQKKAAKRMMEMGGGLGGLFGR